MVEGEHHLSHVCCSVHMFMSVCARTHTHSPYTTETWQGQEPLSCPKGLFGTLMGHVH